MLWPVAAGLAACTGLPTAPACDETVPSLKQAFERLLPFGSAVTPEQLRGPQARFIARHFNVLVAENVMKPQFLAPDREGRYDFAAAEEVVDFALAHGMQVRGHTLMWHRQMPSWFFRDGDARASRELLIARIERYIADVVGHFKGRVYAWDVVNEAITDGEPGARTDANGLRIAELYETVGPEYIDIAFRAAAKADPDALLFYNDYETQSPNKVALISRLVKRLKDRGVKIDGIGHQAHCSAGHPSVAAFERAIDAYAQLEVTQHVTELDVALNDGLMDTAVVAATPELLARQARRYRELVSLFLRKRAQVTALLVWGIGDEYTWLASWPQTRFEAPLLFDTRLRPKPAFDAVLEAARHAAR
jgi:endo-1,4-beta-xylanase